MNTIKKLQLMSIAMVTSMNTTYPGLIECISL